MNKVYCPGASAKYDYYLYCDCCNKDDGREVLIWRKQKFALCIQCIRKLYIKHVSKYDKRKETITMTRLKISEKLRNKIFKKYNYKCKECDSTLKLEIDHIIPFCMGGKTEEKNLQLLCKKCNIKKRSVF